MPLQKETIAKLKNLANSLGHQGDVALEAPIRIGTIPQDIQQYSAEGNSLRIQREQYEQYSECLEALKKEVQFRNLSDREIDRELWHFACEVLLESAGTKPSTPILDKVKSLEAKLRRPMQEYEVLVPIDNLNLHGRQFNLGGFEFLHCDSATVERWGNKQPLLARHTLYSSFVDKAIAITTESGTAPANAVEEVRRRLMTALSLLRVSLLIDHDPRVIVWLIRDEELLFTPGEWAIVRRRGESESSLVNWERGFRPIELNVEAVIFEQLERSRGELDILLDEVRLPKPLRDRLLRALESVGDSVMRARVDDKIVDLCTALETLLATEQDKRKGEAITLRMMLLSDLLQERFYLPHQILEIYVKRSGIVHGSKRDICTHDDYKTMRRIVIDVFGKVLRYFEKYEVKKHSTFLRDLGKEEQRVRNATVFWRKRYRQFLAKGIEDAAERIIRECTSK